MIKGVLKAVENVNKVIGPALIAKVNFAISFSEVLE